MILLIQRQTWHVLAPVLKEHFELLEVSLYEVLTTPQSEGEPPIYVTESVLSIYCMSSAKLQH